MITLNMIKVISSAHCVTGPGCNLFLRQLNFFIGPFPVDKYTSPGVRGLKWCTSFVNIYLGQCKSGL